MAEGKLEQTPSGKTWRRSLPAWWAGEALLDLCYAEDSSAEADMNFVGTESGGISEVQIAGEKRTVSDEEFMALLALCKKAWPS